MPFSRIPIYRTKLASQTWTNLPHHNILNPTLVNQFLWEWLIVVNHNIGPKQIVVKVKTRDIIWRFLLVFFNDTLSQRFNRFEIDNMDSSYGNEGFSHIIWLRLSLTNILFINRYLSILCSSHYNNIETKSFREPLIHLIRFFISLILKRSPIRINHRIKISFIILPFNLYPHLSHLHSHTKPICNGYDKCLWIHIIFLIIL